MPLGELLDAMQREATSEAAAIVEGARQRAEQLAAQAASERALRRSQEIARFARDAQTASDAVLAATHHTATAATLRARAELLDRVHRELTSLLPELASAIGPRLVAAALACADRGAGVLRCAPALADHARQAAPASIVVEARAEVATGVQIELASGTLIVATLAALCEREWPRLAGRVVDQVSPEVRR